MNIIDLTTPYPVFSEDRTWPSNQNPSRSSQAFRRFTLEQTPTRSLVLHQSLRQPSIEGIRNLEGTLKDLQATVQSQASELLLVKEQLRTAEQQKKQTVRDFEVYKKVSNAMMKDLLEKVDGLQQQILQLQCVSSAAIAASETRFTEHTHAIPDLGYVSTSVPNNAVVSQDPNCKIS
ncbi:MAG: hypothetical protein WA347_00830 [Rhabdochlamydiaceae bacterium]|jgi:hypothetical protein